MRIYKGTRGGCKDPYSGLINPARIDFVADVMGLGSFDTSKHTGVQLFAFTLIGHAMADYLFFGKGRNGYQEVDQFWSAYEFFFRTRSWDPETWQHAPPIVEVTTNPETGKRAKRITIPCPETLKLQCFDTYFEVSNLQTKVSMERFIEGLKNARLGFVQVNREYIRKYLGFRRGHKYYRNKGQQEFDMEPEGFIEALVCPSTPEELEAIVYPPPPFPLPAYSPRRRLSMRRLKHKTSFAKPPAFVYGQQEFPLTEAA